MSLAGISSTSFSQLQANAAQLQSNPAQSYFRERGADLKQLGQALQSGDLAGAQQAYTTLTQLAQSAPWQTGANQQDPSSMRNVRRISRPSARPYNPEICRAPNKLSRSSSRIHMVATPASTAGSSQASGNTIAEIIVNLNNAGSNLLAPAASSAPATSGSATSATSSIAAPVDTAASGSATTPASSVAPADTTPSASSSPEIILNLGNSSGSSVPEITINLNQGSSGGSAPELVINLQNGSNGSTPEVTLNLNNGNGSASPAPEITLNVSSGGGSGSNGGNGLEFIFTPGPGGPASQSGGLQIDIVA